MAAGVVINVDDDVPRRKVIGEVLESAGFEVRGAGTAAELFELVRGADVVVLDVMLPDLDGFEACRRLKKNPRTAAIPVLHVSSRRVEPLDVGHGLDCGSDGYLSLPVDPIVLIATVRALVRAKRAEDLLRQRAVQQSAIAEFSQRALTGTADASHEAAARVKETLAVESAAVLELGTEGSSTRIQAAAGVLAPYLGRVLPIVEGGFTDRALRSGDPIAVQDAASDVRMGPVFHLAGARSALMAVVLAGPRPFGILAAFSSAPGRFGGDDLTFLRSMANVLSSAIERARGDEALRRSGEQLRQAQKMEAIGRLAGGIAHDFNNLLTAILGYADMAQTGLPEGHPVHGEVVEIGRAARRASALTRQLLAFSRKQILSPRVIDLNAVVRDMEGMLQRLIGERIELALDLATGIPCVRADPHQIEQVIVNLAVNARDAMAQGGRLSIGTQELFEPPPGIEDDAPPTPAIALRVSDTGSGMDAAVRSRLFEPFFTTKELGKGTGLGLATVYGIVKQSGGAIHVASAPGEGTTFTILFTPVASIAEEDPKAAPKASGDGEGHVLVVEDDALVLSLVSRILREKGYDVVEAETVEQALHGIEGVARLDLIITDLVLPRGSGRELAARLLTRHPRARVLYMSGYGDDAQGATDLLEPSSFIAKPFAPDVFIRKVRDVLAAGAEGSPATARS